MSEPPVDLSDFMNDALQQLSRELAFRIDQYVGEGLDPNRELRELIKICEDQDEVQQ